MKVLYSAYFSSASGMSEAARNIVTALYLAGKDKLKIATHDVPNIQAKVDLGNSWQIAKLLNEKSNDHDIKIIHLTPDIVTTHLDPTKYHIFHLFWETDSLPKWWAWALNLVDEVWTGEEYHAEVFRKSGVKSHIWVCPQPIDTTTTSASPFVIKQHKGFLFYSAFQWLERKNPRALLTAYWKEFSGNDKVGLLIKTYKEFFTMEEAKQIMNEIKEWKQLLGLSHYPKAYLYPYSMTKHNMNRFHATGDCFVTSHRGEGWGRFIAEAMLFGKPVITTSYGGINEYLNDKISFPVRWRYENVHGMNHIPWYESSQKWASIDEDKLRETMRYVYEHPSEAKEIGRQGQKFVVDNFNMLKVGNMMVDRLETIKKDILDKQV